MHRAISPTMASQHPDHAAKPYWHKKEFISTHHEVNECFLAFSELGIGEYKWDWEGKFVDESIIEKLYSEHFDYFTAHPIGQEKFITFRLPNPKVETEFRLGRAYMSILGASGLARQVGMHPNPLFEVILPMTESAEEMMEIQESFEEIASLKHPLYNLNGGTLKHIEMIPLFENVETISTSDAILRQYFTQHKERFGFLPSYLRPYVARSDPAMNSGIVPTVLAIKIALSRYAALEAENGIPLFPVIGSASLPFRGGLTPYTVDGFVDEYRGVQTALIQSAFRCDYPLDAVKAGIQTLTELLPQNKARLISQEDQNWLRSLFTGFETPYRHSIESAADLVNTISLQLPKRRERVQHIGLFGYSRGVGSVRLPRAIGFTGSLYSIGIPPELVGTGRGIAEATKRKLLPLLERTYIRLRIDLRRAGRFLSRKNLVKLATQNEGFRGILEDIERIGEFLGEELGPETDEELGHRTLAEEILLRLENNSLSGEILGEAALLRHSLG